jgi:hypothetical protein
MYNPWEENEISKNANGGTEQIKRKLGSLIDKDLARNFQIICSRVRQLRDDKIRIYWIHDLPNDSETNHLKNKTSRDRFHKIVFCGHWQYNQYMTQLQIPYDDKISVIDNAIDPIPVHQKLFDDGINLCYLSTPHRGLELLIPVFNELVKSRPNIKLHVYSSFKIYGNPDADNHVRFAPLFEQCKLHPNIVYHGSVTNDQLRNDLQSMHILAYPSIWPECNSIMLMEAMSAGLLAVHPNFAGLSDTSGGLTMQYQFHQDGNTHARRFYHVLDTACQQVTEQQTQQYLTFVKDYADLRFSIDKAQHAWTLMMKALVDQVGDNRGLPPAEPMFSYSVQ